MPAVMNSMSAPSISSAMRSRSSSAASRPTSGLAPAPRPLVTLLPSCSCSLAWLRFNACASVLMAMNSTPFKPELIMWSTALPPQPPTPITLITASWVSTSISSNILLSSCLPKQKPHSQNPLTRTPRCVECIRHRRQIPFRRRSAQAQQHQKFPLNQLFMRSNMSFKLLPDSFGASRPRASRPAISKPVQVAKRGLCMTSASPPS